MRVAYLTADSGVPVLGTKGASSHVRGFLEAVRSQGHDLFVLTANIGDDADPSLVLKRILGRRNPFSVIFVHLVAISATRCGTSFTHDLIVT